MTLAIVWNGKEYDVDLREYTARELDLIERKTGLDWTDLLSAALNSRPTAIRALFWAIDQRDDKDLIFDSYDGPALSVWMPHLGQWKSIVDDLGKLWAVQLGKEWPPQAPPAPDGSDGSASDADTPPNSTTP